MLLLHLGGVYCCTIEKVIIWNNYNLISWLLKVFFCRHFKKYLIKNIFFINYYFAGPHLNSRWPQGCKTLIQPLQILQILGKITFEDCSVVDPFELVFELYHIRINLQSNTRKTLLTVFFRVKGHKDRRTMKYITRLPEAVTGKADQLEKRNSFQKVKKHVIDRLVESHE